MLNSVEKFLNDDHHDHDQSNNKDQSSGAAAAAVMVEGTLASGVEIWLRDVGNAKSAKSGGLVLERWWVDHRLRTVVMSGGGGGGDQEHGRKGSGKGKAKKGGSAVFSEEDREFCL